MISNNNRQEARRYVDELLKKWGTSRKEILKAIRKTRFKPE